jgi:pimeloyl-ACP methyl ester carboxylesterase
VRFVAVGSGVPVVALHGWTADHRLMHGCLEPLFARRSGYRRLYPDLPGMGGTAAPPSIVSSDDVLAAVHGFVDEQLGSAPFLLVGESYGGYLSRAVARDRGAQVRGLALICPIGTAVRRDAREVPPHRVLRSDPGLVDGLDPRLAEEFTGMAVVQTPETLRRFRDEVQVGLDVADRSALERIAQRWELGAAPERGTPFDGPTLILTGRQDSTVGYSDHVALLPHYPRATFAVLDVAGHNLQIEQPVLFEALMNEWLDRVAAEGQPPASS